MKLHLHPPVLVGPDLLAGLADYGRGLGTRRRRTWRASLRAKRTLAIDGGEGATEYLSIDTAALRFVLGTFDSIGGGYQQIFAVVRIDRKIGRTKQGASGQSSRVATSLRLFVVDVYLFKANAGVAFAILAFEIVARIVVVLEVGPFVGIRRRPLGQQIGLWGLEIEIVQEYRSWLHLLRNFPIVEVIG